MFVMDLERGVFFWLGVNMVGGEKMRMSDFFGG